MQKNKVWRSCGSRNLQTVTPEKDSRYSRLSWWIRNLSMIYLYLSILSLQYDTLLMNTFLDLAHEKKNWKKVSTLDYGSNKDDLHGLLNMSPIQGSWKEYSWSILLTLRFFQIEDGMNHSIGKVGNWIQRF